MVLAYPPNQNDAISITEDDMLRLRPNVYLNDKLIDFYLKYLVIQSGRLSQLKIYCFNTFFYERLVRTEFIEATQGLEQHLQVDYPLSSPFLIRLGVLLNVVDFLSCPNCFCIFHPHLRKQSPMRYHR